MFPIRVKAYRSGGTSPDFRKIVVVEFEKKPLQKLLRIITAKSGYEQKQIEEDRMSFNQECQKNFSTDWELLFSCQHSLRLTAAALRSCGIYSSSAWLPLLIKMRIFTWTAKKPAALSGVARTPLAGKLTVKPVYWRLVAIYCRELFRPAAILQNCMLCDGPTNVKF